MDGGTRSARPLPAADVENAYELMKQWRDANPSDEAVQMFRLNSRSILVDIGRRQTVSQR